MMLSIFGIIPVKSVYPQIKENLTLIIASEGSDNNPGTFNKPLATLEAARDLARKSGARNKRVVVMPGKYYLTKTLELDSRDNGLTIVADSVGQATLFGGSIITGWEKDGEKLWKVDLSSSQEGIRDIRSLVVNGRLAEKARMPEKGTLLYKNKFDLQHQGGIWANQPKSEDYTRLQYKPGDLPASLDTKNAEVRIYHIWNESLTGILLNDTNSHELVLSSRAIFPLGSMEKNDYLIYNTREGMTKPGQWYHDRTHAQLVYWPLEGENMSEVKVVVPEMERIIRITGNSDKYAENIQIHGLKFQCTNVPFMTAGSTCSNLDGAVSISYARNCILNELEISNVGGNGIHALDLKDCRIVECHVHHTGGTGIWQSGTNLLCVRNHIHHVGLYYPSAIGLSAMGEDQHIYRNEVHDIPYCGMNVCCIRNLIEENLIYRVMLELQDGAAIYVGGGYESILRGNVVRDIKSEGKGYGISSYYLDEGTHDCIIENNISINVSRPVHNHIAFNSTIRNNTFITDGDMVLSFQTSANFSFEDNTLIAPGRIDITQPNGISVWKGNKIFSGGSFERDITKPFTIESLMPDIPLPSRKTEPIEVFHIKRSPVIDGEIAKDEWPGKTYFLNRELSRHPNSGRPVFMKLSYDEKYLYIAVVADMFRIKNLSEGETWGKNDGVEISFSGNYKGKPVTYVIRSYANGKVQSITDGEAPEKAVEGLDKKIQFVSAVNNSGWIGEWAVPLKATGLRPEPNMEVAFNVCAFINEYGNWHCWEGTQGESWQADRAGKLILK